MGIQVSDEQMKKIRERENERYFPLRLWNNKNPPSDKADFFVPDARDVKIIPFQIFWLKTILTLGSV